MLTRTLFNVIALVGATLAANPDTPNCSAEQRLQSSKQVIVAYASNPLETYNEFDKIPFGAPDKAGGALTTM